MPARARAAFVSTSVIITSSARGPKPELYTAAASISVASFVNRNMTISPSASPAYSLQPIGVVHSNLTERKGAPRQGYEGAPDACVEVHPDYVRGLWRHP